MTRGKLLASSLIALLTVLSLVMMFGPLVRRMMVIVIEFEVVP